MRKADVLEFIGLLILRSEGRKEKQKGYVLGLEDAKALVELIDEPVNTDCDTSQEKQQQTT